LLAWDAPDGQIGKLQDKTAWAPHNADRLTLRITWEPWHKFSFSLWILSWNTIDIFSLLFKSIVVLYYCEYINTMYFTQSEWVISRTRRFNWIFRIVFCYLNKTLPIKWNYF
jgi:hypothetical protein